MCDNNNKLVNGLGYAGGIVLSICLFPQILKVMKTREVSNISYVWQFMYIFGLSLHFVYGIYYDLLPIYIPVLLNCY